MQIWPNFGYSVAYSPGGGGGTITPSVSVSRTSGVAPFTVHFDATATTSTDTSRPFHDIEYFWDFGDETTSTWDYGTRPGVLKKNEAYGPVAVHTFLTAGTRTPTCRMRYRNSDGSFEQVTHSFGTITATAADTEWAGTKTICVSSSGNFTGAPSGATPITSSDADAVIAAHQGSGNVRILFKELETFSLGSTVTINQPGPSLIGSFGPGGDKAIIQSTIGATNSGMFRLSTSATPTTVSDWRFDNLTIKGISGAIAIENASTAFYADGSFSRFLFHRVDIQDVYYGLVMSEAVIDSYNSSVPFTHAMWDEVFMVDSSIYNLTPGNGPNAIFASAVRSAVIGTNIDNNGGGEHGIRFQLLNRGVLSYNTVQNTAVGKTNMTIRGCDFAGNNTNAAGTYSEKNVISSNKYVGGLGIGPQNQDYDERGRNMIVESNWWHLGTTLNSACNVNQSDVTIRNNFVYVPGNNGGSAFGAKPESTSNANIPTRVHVYNNTVYHGGTAANYVLFLISANNGNFMPDSTFECKNNILYSPNISSPEVYDAYNGATSTTTQSNNSPNPKTNPLFAALPTLTLADFLPGSGSYANGGGTATAVCSDFYRTATPTTPDMGAVII